MSGFAGVLRFDGVRADPEFIKRLANSLAFRGPDAQGAWASEGIGLAHALLRTTFESENETQPATLDDVVWCVSDVRLDARADLIAELKTDGREVRQAMPDVELLLHAYQTWGEGLLNHISGDFSFAIWDRLRGALFCANDHFAVRPFYYARTQDALIFGNTLESVRLHPEVSSELNEQAIADFLLVGLNWNPGTTSFAQIQRLPAAHKLTCINGEVRTQRYWSFPVEEPLRYTRKQNYPEHFLQLLRAAVSDRMRTSRAGILMSGGLDSTSIAAVACDSPEARAGRFELHAVSLSYDRVIHDEERKYSSVAAKHLGISIEHFNAADGSLFEGSGEPEGLRTAEPYEGIANPIFRKCYTALAAHAPVFFTGQGGDLGLVPSIAGYMGAGLGRLLWGSAVYAASHGGRHPRLGFRVWWQRRRGQRDLADPFPNWLNEDFVTRLSLRERWREILQQTPSEHPHRPEAHGAFFEPYFQWVFETEEPGITRQPLEARHPYFDLRLMRFLLRLPPLPWCAEKEIVRQALQELLPEAILRRPKTAYAEDPEAAMARANFETTPPADYLHPNEEILRFVCWDRLAAHSDAKARVNDSLHLRPKTLLLWLKCQAGTL
ncbi:MAG TPA: asparagine synthase-related protein [Candidatus Acidoferrales bacterium]|nr:asparagine synthase-related protein [Candidatus Acidoferrales bacterium]